MDAVTVTAEVYEQLDKNYDHFRSHVLISSHQFSEDWPTWEMHPNGDELVILLSGEAEFLIHVEELAQRIQLSKPGESVIVPKGCWHTALVASSASMLFVTPGEGTRNETKPED